MIIFLIVFLKTVCDFEEISNEKLHELADLLKKEIETMLHCLRYVLCVSSETTKYDSIRESINNTNFPAEILQTTIVKLVPLLENVLKAQQQECCNSTDFPANSFRQKETILSFFTLSKIVSIFNSNKML